MTDRTVRSLLARSGLVQASAENTVRDAAQLMAEARCGSVLVMDGERLEGIFTERDLLMRVVAADRDPRKTRLSSVLTRQPETVEAGSSICDAIRIMHAGNFRHLPVMEGGRCIGVLSLRSFPIHDLGLMAEELGGWGADMPAHARSRRVDRPAAALS